MGLTDVFRNAAQSAILAFGDIVSIATYHSSGTFVWAPATGENVETGGTDTSKVKLILADYTLIERDGKNIPRTDERALIPYNFLTTTPKKTDYFTISGTKREVQEIEYDPAKALWDLQVRKSA